MSTKHIVLAKFAEATGLVLIAELSQAFAALALSIPGITCFEAGQNNSPEGLNHGFTHVFVMTFINAAARNAYLSHPKHLDFVGKLKPWLANVLVVDYELSPT